MLGNRAQAVMLLLSKGLDDGRQGVRESVNLDYLCTENGVCTTAAFESI